MIERKDVIRMRIPFPNIQAKLALQAHMYICMQGTGSVHSFVKCQTLKPYMLDNAMFVHYVDEPADINRNPFMRMTRIDCDKLFSSASVYYDDAMKTPLRPDICQELYIEIEKELLTDGYKDVLWDGNGLVLLNKHISKNINASPVTCLAFLADICKQGKPSKEASQPKVAHYGKKAGLPRISWEGSCMVIQP